MSANSTDLRLSFAAAIGASFRLGLNTSSQQTDDIQIGAIPPGKYFVQVIGLGANTCWIKTGAFEKGVALPDAVVPGAVAAGASDRVNEFPLVATGVESLVLHVREGVNDRIAAILTAGTATLVMTKTGE